jgi:hypothetical protein
MKLYWIKDGNTIIKELDLGVLVYCEKALISKIFTWLDKEGLLVKDNFKLAEKVEPMLVTTNEYKL